MWSCGVTHSAPWWQPDNQCLVYLGVSYRTYFSLLVSNQSNIATLRCRKMNEKQVVPRLPSTACEVLTFSTCTPSLCSAGEVGLFHLKNGSDWQAQHRFSCCLPLWVPSEPRYSGLVADHCGVHKKETDLRTWTYGTNARRRVHSQNYPLRLEVFGDLIWLRTSSPWSHRQPRTSWFDTAMFPAYTMTDVRVDNTPAFV